MSTRRVPSRRSRSWVPGLLGLLLVVGACGSDASVGPGGAIPSGLRSVWVVEGGTDQPPLHETTYFNDAGAPRLRPGETWVAWTCSGAGTLVVGPVYVPGTGPVPPPSLNPEMGFELQCPTGDGPRSMRLSRPALGGEDAMVVRPAIQPMGPVEFRIEILQQP
jgi:hypothetical protein